MVLEPDRAQLEVFIDAIFRHASPQGFVAVRSFYEDEDRPFSLTAAAFTGDRRVQFLTNIAESNARTAAQAARPAVFCPPLAIFADRGKAREIDVLQGLALSVECDEHPQQARQVLEHLLGPATVVVRSGGVWINGSATPEDKLHLHWRLAAPAGRDKLDKLKQARALATKLVGGDASNVPPCHPIRWPGSWHRKAEPRLCAIDTARPDNEIDLDAALATLTAAVPQGPANAGNDATNSNDDWPELVADIISGKRYHEPLTKLAARCIGAGMCDGQTVKLLRAMMLASTAQRDDRWQARIDTDTLHAVTTAQQKFGPTAAAATPAGPAVHITEHDAGDDTDPIPPRAWLLATQFCRGFLSSLIAASGIGKSSLRMLQLLALATGTPLSGQHVFRRSKVLLLSFEDDRAELRRRLAAACLHHGVDCAKLKGWFFYDCPKGLKIAEMVRGTRHIGLLEKELRDVTDRIKPDVISLDPFVKLHALEENDNNAMDFVCDLLAQLAIEFNLAVDVPHHTRKGSNAPGDPDASRGASSMIGAGRLVFSLMPMNEDEAEIFGIAANDRHQYVRLDPAKANIIPRTQKATWFRLVNVALGNGTEDYPNGDHVQTVEAWSPPDLWANLSATVLNGALTEIDRGFANGQRYSDAPNATHRGAWNVVARHCAGITEAQAKKIVRTWVRSGLLYRESYTDPVDYKERQGLRVDDAKRPT
jgi:hypothetical protein